ncbi:MULTISPECIES: adenylyl-sulfate kinase [Chitinophagaceae]
MVMWLTGLSGAGKTTIAYSLQSYLSGQPIVVLDGDELRNGINKYLDFSEKDRIENVRRTAELAKLLIQQNYIVIVSLITPLESMRDLARKIIEPSTPFFLIYVNANILTCSQRDVKGLYAKAYDKEIPNFTGISMQFEEPQNFDMEINTNQLTVGESIQKIIQTMNHLTDAKYTI